MILARPLGVACTVVTIALFVAACGGGREESGLPIDPAPAPELEVLEETRVLIRDDGGVAKVGDASLTVPPGSLAPGTFVVAQQLADPASGDDPLSVAATPGPVRFVADAEVLGPLIVSIPVRAGTNAARILSAEDDSILWSDETTQVVDGFAIAEIDHLSLFDAVPITVSNLQYVLFRLMGARTDVPDCPLGPPSWVEDIISSTQVSLEMGMIPNGPLLTCGDQVPNRDGDQLSLRVAANRGYSVVVRGPEEAPERQAMVSGALGIRRADIENQLLTGFADALGSSLGTGGVEGRPIYAIPALRTSEFLLSDPLGGDTRFQLVSFETVPPLDRQALALSVLVDLYSVALAQLGSSGAEDLAECVEAIVSADGADGIEDAVAVFDACVAEDPEETVTGLLKLQTWFRRVTTPVQIGLLTVERTVDMWNPDMIHIAAGNGVGQGSGQLPPETAWTTTAMWRGDAGRTGIFPAGAPTTQPDVLWTFRDGDAELSDTVVAAAGRVHATTVDGQLITLDLGTGTELWRFAPPGGAPLSVPSVTDGVVVVHAGGSGVVHALDAATGASRWQTILRPTDDLYGTGAETFVADGKVFITTMTTGEFGGVVGRVDGIRVSDGSIATSTDDRGFLFPSRVAVDGGVLFVGGNRLEALGDLGQGAGWQNDAGLGADALRVAVGSGRVHAMRDLGLNSSSSWLQAVDAETGAELWSTIIESQAAYERSFDRFGGFPEVFAGPVVDSDTVYVGGWITARPLEPAADPYGVLFAFDAATGEERWVTRLSGVVIGSPALSGDVLIVATYRTETQNGHLYGIDRSTGREHWRIDSAGRVAGAFPIGDIILIADPTEGALTALR